MTTQHEDLLAPLRGLTFGVRPGQQTETAVWCNEDYAVCWLPIIAPAKGRARGITAGTIANALNLAISAEVQVRALMQRLAEMEARLQPGPAPPTRVDYWRTEPLICEVCGCASTDQEDEPHRTPEECIAALKRRIDELEGGPTSEGQVQQLKQDIAELEEEKIVAFVQGATWECGNWAARPRPETEIKARRLAEDGRLGKQQTEEDGHVQGG